MTALRVDPAAASLRRRLGPVDWFVLEELALLAGADSVVETAVRDLAGRLSLNKDTVARALVRLKAAGVVVAEPQANEAGRFGRVLYRIGVVPGLRFVDTDSHARPAARSHAPTTTQLSLMEDAEPPGADHPGSASRTTPWEHDALAPGVQPPHACVPRDARDGEGRPAC
ncbi:MAG TPA: hypothetical protein VFJ85_00275 [Acidimicrobiales bacterium]|nr:hypothetical protein [Acidimicrobiales bacterium]